MKAIRSACVRCNAVLLPERFERDWTFARCVCGARSPLPETVRAARPAGAEGGLRRGMPAVLADIRAWLSVRQGKVPGGRRLAAVWGADTDRDGRPSPRRRFHATVRAVRDALVIVTNDRGTSPRLHPPFASALEPGGAGLERVVVCAGAERWEASAPIDAPLARWIAEWLITAADERDLVPGRTRRGAGGYRG